MTATIPRLGVDLTDVAAYADGFPHDAFTWLRQHDPVHWHEPTPTTPDGEGFWVVSRHADVLAVLRDPVTFSSDRGGIRQHGGTGLKDEGVSGTMLNMTDAPTHDRLRSLVNRGFTPRAINALEAELRRRTRRLLAAVGDAPFDAVHAFGRELPAQAICIVLGVPEEDRRQLMDWLDTGIEEDSPSIVGPGATKHLRRYAAELIAAKRADRDNAIMSTIVHARGDDGSGLSERELIAFFALLFPAGAETTRSAISGAVKAFVDHPEQFAAVRANRQLLGPAVEEVVRWTTPSVYKRRTASRDTDLAGTTIRAGDKISVWEMSANRDERVFDEPFRFDVGRRPNPHVGFGFGAHFCLGASLARLELRIAIDELAEHFSAFEAAGAAEWTPNNRLFGLRRFRVRGRRSRANETERST